MTKILVIEDEPSVRKNVSKLLEAEGFQTLAAPNGRIGVELAQQHQPDLIICDILMPELDGYGVLNALHEDPATARIPFIFLTAKADRSELRQGMELGADDYLTKPFTRAELLGAIAVRLDKQKALMQQYSVLGQQAEFLLKKINELQQLSDAKDTLLNNLSQELRQPLSNINLAIHRLKEAPSGPERERYLEILQAEFSREISLINQVAELQRLLTPENILLLRQFNLLKGAKNEKNSSN